MSNEFDIYIRVVLVMISFIVIAVGFVFAFIRYQKKIFAKQKELHQLDLIHKEDLLTNTIHSTEAERIRVAKELHDEVGSILSTLSMSISQVKYASDSDVKHINNSKKLIQDSIKSVRRISRGIAPYELELLGLENTLQNHFDTITSTTAIQIHFKNTFNLNLLNHQTALAIYRISQELTSNCIKYANASQISFNINEDLLHQFLQIKYQDNGIGLDFENRKFSKGIGLKNIESRTIAMNGVCSFTSASPSGFVCEINVPIKAHILNQM